MELSVVRDGWEILLYLFNTSSIFTKMLFCKIVRDSLDNVLRTILRNNILVKAEDDIMH